MRAQNSGVIIVAVILRTEEDDGLRHKASGKRSDDKWRLAGQIGSDALRSFSDLSKTRLRTPFAGRPYAAGLLYPSVSYHAISSIDPPNRGGRPLKCGMSSSIGAAAKLHCM
jgi:hypothetical protein